MQIDRTILSELENALSCCRRLPEQHQQLISLLVYEIFNFFSVFCLFCLLSPFVPPPSEILLFCGLLERKVFVRNFQFVCGLNI